MKTTNNTKSTRRRHFPALALLLAAVSLLALAPLPARAGPSYPFHARFITEFEIVVEYPYLHFTVNGQGRATSMGPTTAVSTDQMVSMIDGSGTGTYTLTSDSAGVREDALILTMIFQATDVPGGISFTGSYTITGGTGRLAGATGSGVAAGSALLVERNNGIGSFSLSGGISYGPGY
jgi:hypothetical protein